MRRTALLGLTLAALLPGPLAAQTYLVVVSGIGGEPVYQERFQTWGSALVSAARDRLRVADDRILHLAEDPARDPRIDGRSTKANLVAALDTLAIRMEAAARLVVVLVGHGSTSGGTPKLNLPGPDLTAAELAVLLDRFPSQEIVVLNFSSASGGWIAALSGERRIVVTATRSATERFESLFGGYFIEALTSDGADLDKDGRVSLLEAFEYARQEVERVYEQQNRLLTEHALLDDDGDGAGAHEPDPATGDGGRAGAWFLADASSTAARPVSDDPELAALYADQARLEDALATLRARKDAMDPAVYQAELERLLIELARTGRAIREREEVPQ
jgi:hypothetical protein